MVQVYKKKDTKKENPVHLVDAVRSKSLWNKAKKIENELHNFFLRYNLSYDYEDVRTRRHITKAIDELKSFRENLRLRKEFEEGV